MRAKSMMRKNRNSGHRAGNYIYGSPYPVASQKPKSIQAGSASSPPSNPRKRNEVRVRATSLPDDCPPFTLRKSIDFLVLNNIAPVELDGISTFLLLEGFKVKYDGQVTNADWGFERMREYTRTLGPRVIIYYKPTSPFTRTLWLQIMQPDKAFLEGLAIFFESKTLAPRIRKLELAYDFFTQRPGEMHEWLIAHLFLKHQRSHSNVFKGTHYANNLRASGNGMRCYVKKRNGKTFTRLEYHASKGFVRPCGIRWLLNELESWNLQNCFAFMTTDEARAIKAVSRQFPVAGNPNGSLREWLRAGMGRRIAESWVRTEAPKKVGLMKRVEQLKDRETGLKKPERFFRVIPFNDLFFDAVSKLRFLP